MTRMQSPQKYLDAFKGIVHPKMKILSSLTPSCGFKPTYIWIKNNTETFLKIYSKYFIYIYIYFNLKWNYDISGSAQNKLITADCI